MPEDWRDVAADTHSAWGAHVGPLIAADEVANLSAAFGAPLRRLYRLPADDYLFISRRNKLRDSRGEVAVCLRRPNGYFLFHTKQLYPDLYRLPTGGIHWGEPVQDALHREVREETGLTLHKLRFLAIIGYQLQQPARQRTVPFVTYLWFGEEAGGQLQADGAEVIAFSELPLTSFAWIARRLRSAPAPRQAWGAWRAIVHEVALSLLSP